ncbi:MAG: hypothetical protein AAB449_01705 [Patescibacteria group bacterium]
MVEEPPKLPQSLYDALKKGEEIAKKPIPAGLRRLFERTRESLARLRNDPQSRSQFLKAFNLIANMMDERNCEIADLNGKPQRFLVAKDFTHATNERYIQSRHLVSPEERETKYLAGAVLVLQPVKLTVHSSELQTPIQFWVWVDSDGWIMRDNYLSKYLGKKLLREIGE